MPRTGNLTAHRVASEEVAGDADLRLEVGRRDMGVPPRSRFPEQVIERIAQLGSFAVRQPQVHGSQGFTRSRLDAHTARLCGFDTKHVRICRGQGMLGHAGGGWTCISGISPM